MKQASVISSGNAKKGDFSEVFGVGSEQSEDAEAFEEADI
jgi:hypothetical protein